jgi:chromate transporter
MIYLKLFFIFFKVGLFGFGGGYAILPMIYQEIQTFGIMSADDFSNLVAISQVTPGPIAINAATYVGYKAAGVTGAAVATLSVSLPSFILIMIVVSFLNKFKTNPTIQNILKGIRPATIGLIASAFVFLAQAANVLPQGALTEVKQWLMTIDPQAAIVFLISLFLIFYRKMGAIKVTIAGAVLGVLTGIVSMLLK